MRYQIGNGFVLISPEDEELVSKHKWTLDGYGYAKATVWDKETKSYNTLRMHTLLMGRPEKGFLIDHRDRNPANNQRHNLRFLTYQQNWYNSKRADKLFSKGKLTNTKMYLKVCSA